MHYLAQSAAFVLAAAQGAPDAPRLDNGGSIVLLLAVAASCVAIRVARK